MPCKARVVMSERSPMSVTLTSMRQQSRGIRLAGGAPNSAVWRYHSAQAVASDSAR
jgi:hypothetical protein